MTDQLPAFGPASSVTTVAQVCAITASPRPARLVTAGDGRARYSATPEGTAMTTPHVVVAERLVQPTTPAALLRAKATGGNQVVFHPGTDQVPYLLDRSLHPRADLPDG
jgi:hypothetical protein